MKKLLLFSAIILFISCNNSPDKKMPETVAVDTAAPATAQTPDFSGCYEMVIAKDTAYMELAMQGDSLSGPLSYRRFEKDKNAGVLKMKLNNGRADGWYVFQSEGKTSVRQIAFEYKDGHFSEAYGDVEMKGDTLTYKFPHNLRFEEKHPFIKVPCK